MLLFVSEEKSRFEMRGRRIFGVCLVIMSTMLVNAALLSAIALLVILLLGLSALQKWSARRRHTPSTLVSVAAPAARWILGLLIVAYLLFIAFQVHHGAAPTSLG